MLQAEGIDDNALLHMKNSTEGTSLNSRADGEYSVLEQAACCVS